MNRWMLIAALPIVSIGAVALNGRAQQQDGQAGPTSAPHLAPTPPSDAEVPPHERDHGPAGRGGPKERGGPLDRGGPDGPMGRGGPDGPGGREGPGGRDGPGGPGGPGGPMDPRRAPSMDTQRNYMLLVGGYIDLSRDSTASGIASVLTAADLLKPRGNAATIEYFNALLPNVKDPAIDRAIRLQLVDLYRASKQPDEALKHLEKLITVDAPAK